MTGTGEDAKEGGRTLKRNLEKEESAEVCRNEGF